MTLNLKNLNSNQREAVQWQDGPLLVLAGPGSGKTYVLTRRIARILSETPDARFRVLGLTFTTKAADEMRTRVDDLLGAKTPRVRLATFHAFAADVLRLHGSHFGFKPDFRILTRDEERFELLGAAIEESNARNHLPPTANGKSIARAIDRLFREGYDGSDRVPEHLGALKPWVHPVCSSYLRQLSENNRLDFGTLLIYCLRLFRERPALSAHYRSVYRFVCVDEYQDTNTVQDELLRILCPNADANLFVVADDDQTIYQWNGANPRRLDELRGHYQMETVQLPDSYRCPPEVVSLANSLIRHNVDRTVQKAPLASLGTRSPANKVVVRALKDAPKEAAWIARDIIARNLAPHECVVLARSSKLLQFAGLALRTAGLSPYLPQRKPEFESPLLCFVHSALRLGGRPADTGSLDRLCAAFGKLTGEQLSPDDIAAEAAPGGESLLRAFADLAPSSADLVTAIRNDLLDRPSYRDFVERVFEWQDATCEQTTEEVAVWKDLDRTIQRNLGGEPTLSQFLQELDMRQKSPPAKTDDIQCLTIHLAKGKEFEHVYLMGLAQQQLPSYYAVRDGGRAVEEERRNCFVAITRARATVTLTYAHQYFGYSKEPSQFLGEMGLAVVTRPDPPLCAR